MSTEEIIKKNILDFIRTKKSELEAKGKDWLGWYHNGSFGIEPTREVHLSKLKNHIHAWYICGSQNWDFYFTPEEI